ncbi:hypothetical protein KGM_204634 [Danaus plexippus plexippus]|uniref:Uncharacterized protein n=1 Tax=Danaus plexippus plexippus TaxID=278856 RepID=A0A212EU35_DANPL|nr:hypothetical protein KGM_204634 [Danaus plexippus plexippus]
MGGAWGDMRCQTPPLALKPRRSIKGSHGLEAFSSIQASRPGRTAKFLQSLRRTLTRRQCGCCNPVKTLPLNLKDTSN